MGQAAFAGGGRADCVGAFVLAGIADVLVRILLSALTVLPADLIYQQPSAIPGGGTVGLTSRDGIIPFAARSKATPPSKKYRGLAMHGVILKNL